MSGSGALPLTVRLMDYFIKETLLSESTDCTPSPQGPQQDRLTGKNQDLFISQLLSLCADAIDSKAM